MRVHEGETQVVDLLMLSLLSNKIAAHPSNINWLLQSSAGTPLYEDLVSLMSFELNGARCKEYKYTW